MRTFTTLLCLLVSGLHSQKNPRPKSPLMGGPALFLNKFKSLKYDQQIKVFDQSPVYNGTWSALPSSQPLFNGFINRQGKSEVYIEFADQTTNSGYRILVNFCDEKYLDTKEAYIVFNLTNTTYDDASSSFYLNSTNSDPNDLAFARYHQDHLIYWYVSDQIDLQVTMTLTDATTMKPFNISNQTDPTVVYLADPRTC